MEAARSMPLWEPPSKLWVSEQAGHGWAYSPEGAPGEPPSQPPGAAWATDCPVKARATESAPTAVARCGDRRRTPARGRGSPPAGTGWAVASRPRPDADVPAIVSIQAPWSSEVAGRWVFLCMANLGMVEELLGI